jgi:hypothetical protein
VPLVDRKLERLSFSWSVRLSCIQPYEFDMVSIKRSWGLIVLSQDRTVPYQSSQD